MKLPGLTARVSVKKSGSPSLGGTNSIPLLKADVAFIHSLTPVVFMRRGVNVKLLLCYCQIVVKYELPGN